MNGNFWERSKTGWIDTVTCLKSEFRQPYFSLFNCQWQFPSFRNFFISVRQFFFIKIKSLSILNRDRDVFMFFWVNSMIFTIKPPPIIIKEIAMDSLFPNWIAWYRDSQTQIKPGIQAPEPVDPRTKWYADQAVRGSIGQKARKVCDQLVPVLIRMP